MNYDNLSISEIQSLSQIAKHNQRTVTSGVIYNPKIKLRKCHFDYNTHSSLIADNLMTTSHTQESIHLGKLLNNHKKPFGPKITYNKLNNTNIEGDKPQKFVNFEEHHCLCQYIRDSPPKSFKIETTSVLFDLNDC